MKQCMHKEYNIPKHLVSYLFMSIINEHGDNANLWGYSSKFKKHSGISIGTNYAQKLNH